ncbi:MAG: lysophospholipid acyltransferase family protein [Acidobacteria bacterium]|nr:lysophospholipid acyltransferase family protein [Acidobacteriota bacterium]
MKNADEKLFSFDSLEEYSWKERMMIRLADLAFFGFTKSLGSTVRFEVIGREHWEAVEKAGKIPIYIFWHDSIILSATYFHDRGIVVMASRSFDGEYIARFVKRMGFGTIRGSSSKGGARALIEMVRAIKNGHPMAFTIDGPRGPRHVVKPGPVMLAKKTGNPVLPFVIEPRHRLTLKSWDKMHIPRPFTKAALIFGEPVYVDPDAYDAQVESKHNELQRSMDELTRRREEWSSAG